MKHFILGQSETEIYTSHSGLALVGLCLNRYGNLNQALKTGIPLRHGISCNASDELGLRPSTNNGIMRR